MKTNSRQSAMSLALKGAATAFLALGIAALAPVANAQTGTLTLSNPTSCSSFSGFTWNGSTLSITCTSSTTNPPPTTTCDTTQPGAFSWASPTSATITPGSTATGTIVRTGGCKGQYTITFGTDAAAYPGVTVSPTNSVSFADGSATSQTVTVTTTASTPVGTNVSVYLNGFTSSTGSGTPAIGGTFVAAVQATQPPPPPPPTGNGCSTSATYNVALNGGTQLYWGTNEYDSRPPLKPSETIAASFTYVDSGSWGEVDLAQVTNYVQGGTVDTEVSIDACPGNFPATTADTACDKRVSYPATGGPVIYGFTNGATFGMCALQPGKTYYVNIRNVRTTYGSGTSSSCTNTNGCAIRFRGINFN